MPTFVGLDCGGSSTRVVAVDETGETLFRGQGGGANLVSTEPELLARSLRRATEGCPPATAVCAAFAGLVGPESRGRAHALVERLFPEATLRIEPDYAAAHAAAPDGTDATVIAGTGSLVCGPDATGRVVKTGVGGYLLGDEGSGYRFGRAALAHYLRHPERRSPAMMSSVAREFGKKEESEIVAVLHRAPSPPALLARLLPAFAEDLEAGLEYAVQAARREEADLAATVSQHAKEHLRGRASLQLSLAGGVWNASREFERIFREALEAAMPGAGRVLRKLTRPPVQGAVALAKEAIVGNGE